MAGSVGFELRNGARRPQNHERGSPPRFFQLQSGGWFVYGTTQCLSVPIEDNPQSEQNHDDHRTHPYPGVDPLLGWVRDGPDVPAIAIDLGHLPAPDLGINHI